MTDKKPDDSKQPPEGAGKDNDDDSLDSLLASWDKDKGGKKTEPPAKKEDDSPLAKEVANMRYQLEMEKIVKLVKADLDVDDDFVETYVNMRGAKDPRLLALWDDRDSNRAEFNKAMKALAGDFAKFVKAKDAGKDEKGRDDKGLAAAAHMARKSPGGGDLDSLNFGAMSDADFAFKKQEVFRLAASGKLT